jgi:hypothetical protein
LRKAVSLLNKIEAKTGSATITGPVTVTNEVEIKNDANNPLPVSDNNGSLTVDGTVELGSTSLAALENISVTFPATQNVNVTNAGLSVSVSNLPATQPVSLASVPSHPVTGTFWQATQPVSLASAPVTPVTDNGGSLTVDGTVTVNDMTSGNAKTKIVDSAGADVSYITAGTAGTPSAGVLSVQGINGGVSLPISGTVTANGGDFTGQNNNSIPDRSVQIGFFDTYATGDFVHVNNDGRQFPVKAYGVSSVGNSNVIPVAVGNEGNKPSTGVPIAWSDDEAPDTRIVGTSYPLPIQAPNGIAISGTVTAVDLGAKADAVASTDTGTFSVIALIKRGLQNWTSLLAKIPALVSGRIPVDGSGVTQPVSGTITAAQATAANLNATVVGSGSFTAAQATAANLNATVVQGTATNLKTQAEVYQGGSAVGSSNQLFVKTNTTYGGNSPIVVPGFYQSGLNNYLGVSDGSGLPIRPANSTTFAVTGTFWQATQPVSGTVTINNSQGATVTQSTFISTTASTSLVAASANRKTLTVFNEGAGVLYVSVGSTCTTTAYQVRLSAGDYWECPPNQTSLAHTAVFATAGNARVTEVV